MEKFIPMDAHELVEKMKENNFKGEYTAVSDFDVCWNIHPEVKIDIIVSYQSDEACVYYPNGGHAHIPSDELWDDLVSTNEEGGVIIKRKSWLFGWQTEVYFGKEYKEKIKFF